MKMKTSFTTFVCSLAPVAANPAVRRRAKSFKSPCQKALDKAWEANMAASHVIPGTKYEMKDYCEFDTTGAAWFAPNFGCPFLYTPDTGFLDSRAKVVNYFGNTVGIAYWEFQMYCECVKGIDHQCVTKIPDIPPINGTGLDYCIFSSIWNGDIELDLINDTLDEEVRSCGCTFVGTEKDSVNLCPGLDLGANFVDPKAFDFNDPSHPEGRYNLFSNLFGEHS
jgi:hypothetical protein